MVQPRHVTKLMHKMRNFFLQRDFINNNRFPAQVASRDPPEPQLPGGISHKLANNYYCTRDGRRESKPPSVVSSAQALLSETTEISVEDKEVKVTAPPRMGFIIPGAGISLEDGKPRGPHPH